MTAAAEGRVIFDFGGFVYLRCSQRRPLLAARKLDGFPPGFGCPHGFVGCLDFLQPASSSAKDH